MDEAPPHGPNPNAGVDQSVAYALRRTPSSESGDNMNHNPQPYYSYYGSSNITKSTETHELQYQQQSLHENENHALYEEHHHVAPSHLGGRTLPNMILNLAHKLLPTVVQRLHHHDETKHIEQWVDINDDFEGLCAPLGNNTVESQAEPNAHLKTTGLRDEQIISSDQDNQEYPVSVQKQRKFSDLEMGDPSDYLPESAALLITALSKSAKKVPRKSNSKTSLEDLPSLLDEAVKDSGIEEMGDSFPDMDNFEREAEKLLQSIQNEDTKNQVARSGDPSNVSNDQTSSPFDDDDSVGSMGGDIVQLSRSIAFLQHDLENVDLSHIDQMYDDHSVDGFDGEFSAWSRMKLWFSRGMIMEQKILNSINRMDSETSSGDLDTNTSGRYTDNPVLIWSMAIMWAFVLLIMGHSKIADWVEGEDPGTLADIIEWIFG